jgi:2-hydroxy-3-oxopropionate reductase
MGRPMALNLVKGGHGLSVWARRPEAAQPLVDAGAARYFSPAEVAQHSDVVFTIVTTGADVENVALGEGGIIEGARPGTVVIDCSTISPAVTRRICAELRLAGVEMLDAPVSGGEPGAIAGTLSIMVGGNAEVFERVKPVLACVGQTLVHIGESGAGQVAKACNQLALVVTIQGIAEAAVFARANGVDFQPVYEALTKGLAGSRMLELIGPRMLQRQFDAGVDARLHHKDAHIILECAQESKTYVPGAALAAEAFNALMNLGSERQWDSAAILKVLEEMAGFPARDAAARS